MQKLCTQTLFGFYQATISQSNIKVIEYLLVIHATDHNLVGILKLPAELQVL